MAESFEGLIAVATVSGMKHFKFLMMFYRGFQCTYFLHLLIVAVLFVDGFIQGWMGLGEVASLSMFELSMAVIYIVVSTYNGKQIMYVEIENNTAIILDLRKRRHVLPFKDIECIAYSGGKCMIKMKNRKSLWAYRNILRPYVKKDGEEHRSILPTDFVGVRIECNYSSF